MVDSGIRVEQSCVQLAQQLETKKLEGMICRIKKNDAGKQAVMCELSWSKDDGYTWEKFAEKVMGYDIAYGVSYIRYNDKDNCPREKLVFIYWNSDNAKTKDKMTYSSTKESLRKAMSTASQPIQASDKDEFEYKLIVDSVSRGNHNL